jgi:hypothetical protein
MNCVILVAPDCVWEFITSREAVDMVQKSLTSGADCDAACQVLIVDNMLVVGEAVSLNQGWSL